jgi:hypothetical protein
VGRRGNGGERGCTCDRIRRSFRPPTFRECDLATGSVGKARVARWLGERRLNLGQIARVATPAISRFYLVGTQTRTHRGVEDLTLTRRRTLGGTMTASVSEPTLNEPDSQLPLLARWAEEYTPKASTNMKNPDTSTYNKSTEDNDT